MAFDLATLAGHELAELGARIRRCAEDRPGDFAAIARAVIDCISDALVERTPPQVALIDVYRVRGTSRERVATRGVDGAWDDSRLLALDGDFASHLATAFVPDAIGSALIARQRELVLLYGVRSVIAVGGRLPPDDGFELVIYSRARITDEVVAGFGTIGLSAGIALGQARDHAGGLESVEARARALDRLLRLEEFVLVKRVVEQARELDEYRSERASAVRAAAAEQETRARLQERAQRAMLNVIEDLREARADLERRVDERTEALVRANDELRGTNAELEQFAYVASHDLQEPLRTIAGYLQLLRERHGEHLDGEAHEFIDYAVSGAHRLQELIEALLLYSRVSRAPLESAPVPLDGALDDAVESLARSISDSQAQVSRQPLPSVRGDRVLLRQLFQNLLSNAIKFAGATPPRIEVRAERRDNAVVLQVKDHGIGFDPKHAEQIFKVFRRLQRKLPGTGIGLAICKKIVERHGGSIEASALPGAGATFHVTLPEATA